MQSAYYLPSSLSASNTNQSKQQSFRMSDRWIISIVLICLFLTNNDGMVVLSFVPPITTTLSSSISVASWGGTETAETTRKTTIRQSITNANIQRREYSRRHHMAPLAAATNNDISNNVVTLESTSRVGDIFPDGEILTIEMVDHQPLGCTVEESIEDEDDYIFISKLTDKGSAANAGLQVGDVVVGVTGTFGQLTDVLGASVEKIKRLVSAIPVEDPLTLQVVRGTNILERHESAIVDLCNFEGENDNDVEDCVVDFIAGGYDLSVVEDDKVAECDSDDEDAECMIDSMYNMWADELPPPSTTSDSTDGINDESTAPKPWSSRYNDTTDQTNDKIPAKAPPKPWSSRSSGSGTWVLDPKTRKMRNIDK